ncbi:MAG TPA: hypothetical protein VNV41_04410 [Candidatus Acidoferrales bacterium]|jgi:hypothetical protein|nr:hypothetical protein [Candidatus Acidoferrales bacterium]
MRIISILQALLTPVIGLIALYIAWQQWKSNELKLKMEKYDRRLRVYEEVVKMLQKVNRDFKPKWDDMLAFATATAEADFLFGVEIPAYLDEIFSHANKLRLANMEYKAVTQLGRTGINLDQTVSELSLHSGWFTDQISSAKEKFKKYLYIASRG